MVADLKFQSRHHLFYTGKVSLLRTHEQYIFIIAKHEAFM